jgi:hypothetical protein
MSVNERQSKISDLFRKSFKACGLCGTNWPTEVVEIATLNEFDENYRFFTTSCEDTKDGF